jgi:hypothetical protein
MAVYKSKVLGTQKWAEPIPRYSRREIGCAQPLVACAGARRLQRGEA